MTQFYKKKKNPKSHKKSQIEIIFFLLFRLAKRAKSKTLAMTQKGIPSPSNWEDMHGESVVKITLNPSAGLGKLEYESIQRQFEKTLPQAQIISIMRNQNMFMWEMYYL